MPDGSEQPITSFGEAVLDLVGRVGSIEAAVKQAPTHEKLNTLFNDQRRDFAARLDNSEKHVATLIEKQDLAARDRERERQERQKEAIALAAKQAAKEALAEQREIEAKAQGEVRKSDAELDKRIRDANARGWIGLIFGLLGVSATIAKSMGWLP